MTRKLLTFVLGVVLAATMVVMRPADACLPTSGGTCNVTEVVIRAINWEPPEYGELFHFEGKAQGAKYSSVGGATVVDGWFDGFVTMQPVDLPNPPPIELPFDQTGPSPLALDDVVATGSGTLSVNTGSGSFSGELTVALAADGAGVWVVTRGVRAVGSGIVTADQFAGSISSAVVSL